MKTFLPRFLTVSAALAFAPTLLRAAPIFAPGDTVFGGYVTGGNFVVGAVGVDGGNNFYNDNVWPLNESPFQAIDGVGQKYLNFAELNTGVIVTPSLGGPLNTIVTGITIWTANDFQTRDPASYQLLGTNVTITGVASLSDFTLISSGALALPATRQQNGSAALDTGTDSLPANTHQTLTFANTVAYDSYLVYFPTVTNEPAANGMHIGEVQLDGTVVPEPSTLGLLGLTTAGLMALRRRRA